MNTARTEKNNLQKDAESTDLGREVRVIHG
jgi:hypothetical protein